MTRVTLTQFANGTTADASAVNTELAKLGNAINGNIDLTNITPAVLDNTIFSSAFDPVARAKDIIVNFVVSGLTVATSGSLSTTVIGGVYYVSGKKVTISNSPITVTASKDTYVDLKDDGTVVQVPVANGATVGMTLTTNSDGSNALRIAKLVSSGSAITSSTQSGQDPLGNNIYWRSPTILSVANAAVATSETTTSSSYADLTTTTDSVTVIIGPSGIVEVSLSVTLANNAANAFSLVSVALSGSNTVAASDSYAVTLEAYTTAASGSYGNTFTLTGLTAGATTFKMKYRVQGASTGTFSNRRIAVKCI